MGKFSRSGKARPGSRGSSRDRGLDREAGGDVLDLTGGAAPPPASQHGLSQMAGGALAPPASQHGLSQVAAGAPPASQHGLSISQAATAMSAASTFGSLPQRGAPAYGAAQPQPYGATAAPPPGGLLGPPPGPAAPVDGEQRHMKMGISSILHPDMSGMMLKCREHNLGRRTAGWETRYFILKNHVLLCYESDPTKPGADAKSMGKHTVWYDPDDVRVGDPGDGSKAVILRQHNDPDSFLMKAVKGAEGTAVVEQWAEALRSPPPELALALNALSESKASLMKARRSLRNQTIEKQQIEEHLESMTSLQDVEIELTELLAEKQRQMETLGAQLQQERSGRASLEAELKRSQQENEQLEERLQREQEMAKQLITQAKREARKARRAAERGAAQGGGDGRTAADNEAWRNITSVCRHQGADIVAILDAYDERRDGTVDYRYFTVGLSQLVPNCKVPRLAQVLARYTEGSSGGRQRVLYEQAVAALGECAEQAAEEASLSRSGLGLTLASVGATAPPPASSGGRSVAPDIKKIFAEWQEFLKGQLAESMANYDVVVAHAKSAQRVTQLDQALDGAATILAARLPLCKCLLMCCRSLLSHSWVRQKARVSALRTGRRRTPQSRTPPN